MYDFYSSEEWRYQVNKHACYYKVLGGGGGRIKEGVHRKVIFMRQ